MIQQDPSTYVATDTRVAFSSQAPVGVAFPLFSCCRFAMAPKSKQTLLNLVQARREFLDLNVQAGMVAGTTKFQNMSKNALDAIRTQADLLKGLATEEANDI